ncbi:hypothetical protein TrVE_jg7017 [Triparma verrucosa]|uniref:Uracil-DNA glycosylase n=1 Tax=Triparma verrucosa TaxID=1606542 RepID=A0A9W7CGB4_9STRA|nr:hypothetical protein TrVE_jg7017 [Triparma verrucosa]
MSLLAFGFKRKASKADNEHAPLVEKSLEVGVVPSNVTSALSEASVPSQPALKKQKSSCEASGDENTEVAGSNATTTQTSATSTKTASAVVTVANPVAGLSINSPSDLAADFTSTLTDSVWKSKLSKIISSKTFLNLVKFVNSERATKTIFPPPDEVFSAFNLTPFDSVKVIIIGQDPYHGLNQGHGLSFSVKPGVAIPPSLRNIYKMQLETKCITKKPTTGYLQSWASQGVFCLNVTLTVRSGSPNSHETKKKDGNVGWKYFTSSVLKKLSSEKENLVFFGWGKNAENIIAETVDKRKHLVINSSHPSPLGATKTAKPFMGSDCFNVCNRYLEEKGEEGIDWDSVNK